MNVKNIGILFVILILPVLLYFLLRTGKSTIHPLPYYGETTFDGTDSIHYRADLTRLFGDDPWTGKHLVLHFVPDEKSVLAEHSINNLKKIRERLPEVDNMILVSAVVNPKHDYNLPNDDYWLVATATKNEGSWIEHDLLPGYPKSTDYTADQVLVLVDKDRHIRGFYQAGNDRLEKNLLGELRVILLTDGEQQP